MKMKLKQRQLLRSIYIGYIQHQTPEQIEYDGDKKEIHLFGGKIYIGSQRMGTDYQVADLIDLKEKGMIFYKGNHRYELSAAGHEYVEEVIMKRNQKTATAL